METKVKQIILLITPFILLATTYAAFQLMSVKFGETSGYLAGFIFYWLFWCLVVPLLVLGKDGVMHIFRKTKPRFGKPNWLGLAFLIIPLLLGYGYAFPRAIGQANVPIIILSAFIAIINGTLEELLWRGAYLAVFEDRWFLGYVYPAIGFAVWHFAPQSIFPNTAPGGNLSLVAVAGVMGLLWGWSAKKTGSIRWAAISHILFDFSGLGARIYF